MVHTDFAMCLARAIHATRAHDNSIAIAIINRRSSVIAKGRHETVVEAQSIGADKLLFIDSDMTFPQDAFLRMLQHNGRVIGCNCSRRVEPIVGTARINGELLTAEETGTTFVDQIGFGITLIDMSVFTKMEKPYFNIYWDGEKFIGEDYDFCNRCGCKIQCDHDLSKEIGHIGMVTHFIGEDNEVCN